MERFLFKYPLDVYAQGQLFLAGDWPLWALALSVAAGTVLIVLSLRRPATHLRKGQKWIVAIVQVVLLLGCVLLVWRPALEIARLRDHVNSVALLIDGSASMAYEDAGVSRLQQAAAATEHPSMAQLEQRFQLQRLQFGAQVDVLEAGQMGTAQAPTTRLFEALTQVLGQRRSQSLGAVIVVSDGNDEQPAWLPNQLATLASYEVPVHSVVIGREQVPEDIAIDDILMPSRIAPGGLLRARVDIAHDAPHAVVLSVRSADQVLSVSEHQLSATTDHSSIWISLALAQSGHHELEFGLQPVAGERNLRNNSLTRLVQVADQPVRVLYMEGEPRWEYKFLRRAVAADSGIALHSLVRVSPNRFYRQGIDSAGDLESGFPTQREQLFAYDALIIGSIEAASFTDQQIDLIREFVQMRGGGLLMLGGRNGLGEGGWGESALAAALPARLPSAESGSFLRQQAIVARAAPAPVGQLPQFADDQAENSALWAELPALADYQQVGQLKPAAKVLLTRPSGEPVMLHQPYGRGQTFILATGGTWRWQMSLPVEDTRHEQFWRHLLRELASSAGPASSVTAQVRGETVALRVQRRHADFTPDNSAYVEVLVSAGTAPAESIRLDAVPGDSGNFFAQYRPQGSSVVYVEVLDPPVADSGQSQEIKQPPPRVAVHFDARRAEFRTLKANRPLLQAVADTTGGRVWTVAQLDGLPEAVARSGAGVSERLVLPVWDAPLVFLLLLMLKSTEWVLRRRWTTI